MSLAYQKMLSFNRQFKDTKRIYQAMQVASSKSIDKLNVKISLGNIHEDKNKKV